MDLKQAVAVITGGGSGLGEATAREFAAGGAKIVILDLANSPGPKVAESLGEGGLFVAADVASAEETERAIAKGVGALRHGSYRRQLRRNRPRRRERSARKDRIRSTSSPRWCRST